MVLVITHCPYIAAAHLITTKLTIM